MRTPALWPTAQMVPSSGSKHLPRSYSLSPLSTTLSGRLRPRARVATAYPASSYAAVIIAGGVTICSSLLTDIASLVRLSLGRTPSRRSSSRIAASSVSYSFRGFPMKFYVYRHWSDGEFWCASTYRPQLLLSPSSSRKFGAPGGDRRSSVSPMIRCSKNFGSSLKLRLVYCYASPHPTRGKRRSYARNCHRSPAVVRGSVREPSSAARLAAVVFHPAIRTAPGVPKNCREISIRPAASRG